MLTPSRRAKVFVSWSGGKDSALALHALRREPAIEVVGLVTSITRGYDPISVHGVRRALLEAQVKVLGLPLVEISLDQNCSNDAYEAAFQDALRAIKRPGPMFRASRLATCFSRTCGPIASVHWRVADSISGHGFMLAPATGHAVAELVCDGRCTSFDISPLAANRFEQGRLFHDGALPVSS